ncbi:MAG: class I SAM-dependent methyltransferase [Verrucomicrobiae bacterium]|nr:class I SAM-dependent methyltransferase [Verrucomicrobiae bacterium]
MNERLFKFFHEKNAFQRYFARRFLFNFMQRLGFHITGNHFYDLVPDTRFMTKHYSDAPRPLAGIDWRSAECERHAVRLIKTYGPEYGRARSRFGFSESNFYFSGMDALTLFVFLRDLKPLKMIEVGQGSSTLMALAALDLNAAETGKQCEFISIDPYARLPQNLVPGGVNLTRLTQGLQSVDLPPLLAGCDFLFVDSTHVYKFGSDVQHEFTQIYPRLHPGMFVHIHDIYSPYEYPLSWAVQRKQFWNEQYFLEAFLMFNDAFEVTLPLNLLVRQSAAVREAVRALALEPDFKFEGSSFYFQYK